MPKKTVRKPTPAAPPEPIGQGVVTLFSPEQVGQHLGLKASTVHEYIRTGRLKAYKLSASNRAGLRVRADDLQLFIDSLQAPVYT